MPKPTPSGGRWSTKAYVLAQAVIYLCVAAKTDASYKAFGAVQADVEKTVAETISIAHNVEGAVPGMECLPESLAGRQY
jgi:putative ATPase